MRGSGLTRYRPGNQGGGGGIGAFLGNIFNDVTASVKEEARREGWKSLKSGGPMGLPSLFAGVRGVKRGAVRGAKRGVKRKANSAINIANGAAKRAVKDLFG